MNIGQRTVECCVLGVEDIGREVTLNGWAHRQRDSGLVGTALAATAEPSVAEGGDPRSNGQGPGLVGTPGLAIIGVILIAVIAIAVTTAYVRLTTPRDRRGR